jgi:RNA polymerase sigma-70 factor (ECF subfamily)
MDSPVLQPLFMQHYAKMLRVARTILYDELESQDVVSDIFASLLHGHTVLMPETAENYLMRSVRNRCLKQLRHTSVPFAASGCAEPTDDFEKEDERLADIDEFVASHLSAQEQRIFRLRFSDGLSYEEIAAEECISRVAVWKHLSHALNLIKNHFNK